MKKYKINVMRWNLEKYNSSPSFYQKFQILLLMENANTHLVSVFKDYLLYDDMTEFFKEYYNSKELYSRLKTIYEYYESSSYLFPNYTAINEGKYIYRNIIKKQKLIDYLEDLEDKKMEKEQKKLKKNKKLENYENDQSSSSYSDVFNTKVYTNIIKDTGNDSKINEIFCVGNKNNENNCGDSLASIVKLTEEIKEKEKEKEKRENQDNQENKENRNINTKNNTNNNSKSYINDMNNITNNNKSRSKGDSKIYVLKKVSLNQNSSSNSKKIFKKAKVNITVNNIINKNTIKKNIKYSFKKRNQNLNSHIYKTNEYLKSELSSTGSANNKNYKKNNIIINIINNNKTNNYQSNINYYSNYNSNNQTEYIQMDNNRSNLISTSNNKYYNTSNNKIYSTTHNYRNKNNSSKKEKDLKSVIIKHSHNHSKNITKKLKKEIKSKLLSFHLTTDNNSKQRIKSEQSELKQNKIGKDLSQTKSIISPQNNMKKRTKTEILGIKKDKFLFSQANEINSYNYSKSINRQILKSINLTSSNRPHKEISLINKKMLSCQFGMNSSRIERKHKKHTSTTNSQNLTKVKITSTINPLPLKEIIKKRIGVFSSNKTERTSRNHSKENLIKINTIQRRNHLDSFSPKKTEEFIYKKIKKLHNKNSAIICSFLKSVSSNKKIRALKINHRNNMSNNTHLKDIDLIMNNKELFNRLNYGKNC